MTLRIDKNSDGKKTIYHISGRIVSEHVEQLKSEISGKGVATVLDLEYVTYADREGILFLSDCEREGVELLRCSQYIREWIARERGAN